MDAAPGQRHPNYVGLNLVGYGLAKFEDKLIGALGFDSKADLYRDLVARHLAKTRGTLKNRQDLFNPLVRGGRVGWWQNGDRYLHRKIQLDTMFGDLSAKAYAAMLRQYLHAEFPAVGEAKQPLPPLMKSKFRQLQETGVEAELFFMHNYRQVGAFADAAIEDGRQLGDGYDFQLAHGGEYWLAEVKGLRTRMGAIRLTENEFKRAEEFRSHFCLVVVSALDTRPVMAPIFDPLSLVRLNRKTIVSEQIYYHSQALEWTALVA
ncbi:MAG: hypothetical protein QOD99_2699 [Chthoniobacter sp.]|jgi:hypothetical protein|nr:hypothetical protein [Chthoniobacter sp.]